MEQLAELLENHRKEIEAISLENEVLRKLLYGRWSNRDRPVELVISELIEMKRAK